jgi:hypothetical protein
MSNREGAAEEVPVFEPGARAEADDFRAKLTNALECREGYLKELERMSVVAYEREAKLAAAEAALETNVPPGYHHVHHCPTATLADRLAEALRELRQHTLENRTLRAINAALADYEATRK